MTAKLEVGFGEGRGLGGLIQFAPLANALVEALQDRDGDLGAGFGEGPADLGVGLSLEKIGEEVDLLGGKMGQRGERTGFHGRLHFGFEGCRNGFSLPVG